MFCVVCHYLHDGDSDTCKTCGNKTFTPEHRTAPELIVLRAEFMSKKFDYPYEEALGDVFTGLLHEMESAGWTMHGNLSESRNSELYNRIKYLLENWFNKE